MVLAIHPVFRDTEPPAPFLEGDLILRHIEILDATAIDFGKRPLSDFGDNRQVPDGFDGPPEELAEIMGPFDKWYPPQDAVTTVDALLAALAKDVDLVGPDDAPGLQDELLHLRRNLNAAVENGDVFRLELH